MERVLLSELRLLAGIFGSASTAARVLAAVEKMDSPRVWRKGRWLIVCDGLGDTVILARSW